MWNKDNHISLGKWTECGPHRKNTKGCLLLFDIFGISAKKPVNCNIFIYQGNKSEIVARPHFTGATVAMELTRKKFSLAPLRATSCLLPFEHRRLWI